VRVAVDCRVVAVVVQVLAREADLLVRDDHVMCIGGSPGRLDGLGMRLPLQKGEPQGRHLEAQG
jgi:hypothetical protein